MVNVSHARAELMLFKIEHASVDTVPSVDTLGNEFPSFEEGLIIRCVRPRNKAEKIS